READDQPDALALFRRDDLATRVQRDPAAVVDELVPHPQAALLRLAEVVRVEDARHALLAVDLEQGVTRVFNSDYFGESKKGGLRMWNKLVYDRGGIPLHAGCKIIPTEQGKRVGLIVGLSGTGKTTTTFTRQNGSLPVQDDFVAWMPNGHVYATENGCFAKTFGLNPEDEPTIYSAVTQPR